GRQGQRAARDDRRVVAGEELAAVGGQQGGPGRGGPGRGGAGRGGAGRGGAGRQLADDRGRGGELGLLPGQQLVADQKQMVHGGQDLAGGGRIKPEIARWQCLIEFAPGAGQLGNEQPPRQPGLTGQQG